MDSLKKIFTNRTVWLTILIVAFIILVIYYMRRRKRENEESSFAEMVRNDAIKNKLTDKEHELNQYMRKIWAENTFWMRNYIISYLNNSSDMNDVTKRLLKNQEQIGRSIGLWYGDDKGKKIIGLLSQNLVSFGDVLKDMVDKNKNAAIVAEKQWYDNTERLVDYLAKLNPEWSKSELNDHFKKYNEMVISQATAKVQRKHTEEIAAFDKAYNHSMYDLADYLSSGIVKQYPEKFDKDKKSIRKIIDNIKKENKKSDNTEKNISDAEIVEDKREK